MKRILLASVLALAPALGLFATAHAVPMPMPMFNGTLSLYGTATYTSSNLTFQGDGGIGAGTAYGAFAPAFSAGCNSCVALNNIDLTSFTPGTLYTVAMNGVTTSLFLNSIDVVTDTGNTFLLTGSGYGTLTGYADSLANFTLSSQGGRGLNVTFSSTTDVPEPGSLALLGTGLLGLGLILRKRRQA